MATTRVAPPQVLTMEEYRSRWEPEDWQLIIIGPTSTWRQDWGEWEAIRDIVQNALDECEYYTWGYDEKVLSENLAAIQRVSNTILEELEKAK